MFLSRDFVHHNLAFRFWRAHKHFSWGTNHFGENQDVQSTTVDPLSQLDPGNYAIHIKGIRGVFDIPCICYVMNLFSFHFRFQAIWKNHSAPRNTY